MHIANLTASSGGGILRRYLGALYGDAVLAPDPDDLHMLWGDMLGLTAASQSADAATRCTFEVPCDEMRPGVLHVNRCGWQREWDPPSALFVARPSSPASPLLAASHTWVEVTHCSEARKLVIKKAAHTNAWCHRGGRRWCFENATSWMYLAPGSGMFFNVRRTVAYPTPQAAVSAVLNNSVCEDFSCRELLEPAFDRLRALGYHTVQFVRYADQRCNLTSTNIVDLHRRGLDQDPCAGHAFRAAGWGKGGAPCRCVSHDGCARCLPRGEKVPKRTKPCVVCPVAHELDLKPVTG